MLHKNIECTTLIVPYSKHNDAILPVDIHNRLANSMVNRKIVLRHPHEDDMLLSANYEQNTIELKAKQKSRALQ